MIFFNQKMAIGCALCVLMLSTQVAAMQQPKTNPELSARQEKRRQLAREMQELKNARKAENSASKTVEQGSRETASPTTRREALRSAYNLKKNERPAEKSIRLSPEERIALRKQIREARIEIYQRRNEKND